MSIALACNVYNDAFALRGLLETGSRYFDNIFIVHRNKDKEGKEKPDKMIPDQTFRVAKQRHGDWEGKINLWFHSSSTQFVGGPDSMSLRWRA